MLHNGPWIARSAFVAVDPSILKSDPDEFNDYLRVPGVEMPDEEKLRQENEIIAKRKAEANGNGKHG